MNDRLEDLKPAGDIGDGIEDVGMLDSGSKARAYLRRVFYINPIVRQFSGYVLDIGCGVGTYLAGYSGPCLGIDAHANNVKCCRDRGINAVLADANSFVQKDTFDTVLLSHVLEHLTEPRQVLENVYRSTKSGGRIIVVLPCLTGFMYGFNDLVGHRHFITEEYVDHYLMRKSGCKKLSSSTFPFCDLPFSALGKYREIRIIYRK